MATAVIGALRVNLSADTAAFNKGLVSAERRAEKFGRQIGNSIKVVSKFAAAAAAAGAALATVLVKRSFETIDAQSKLAARVGGSVVAIQSLQHAAELAGVGQGTLAKALETLNARLGEAAREGIGPASEALTRLGLSAQALSDMDVDDRIKTLSDRMAELGFTTQQQADVLRDFGIRGGELINLFQGGSVAINQARQDLEAWGVAVSDIDASKIEAANDAIARISTVLQGIGNQIAINVAPIVEAIAQSLTDASRSSRGFADAIQNAVQRVLRSIVGLLDRLQQVRFLFLSISALLAGIDFRAAQLLPWRADEVEGLREEFRKLNEQLQTLAVTRLPSEALDEWLAQAKEARRIAEMFEVAFGGGRMGSDDNPMTEAAARSADQIRQQMAGRLEALQASLLTEREAELNSFAQRMIDLNEFHQAGLISAQEFAELRADVERDHAGKIKAIDDDITEHQRRNAALRAQAFLGLAGQITSALSGLFGESKAFAIAEAIINTAQAITKTLSVYGATPLGFAAAAAAAAAGAAQIAAIRSTSKSGGGSVPAVGRGGGSSAGGGAASPAANDPTGGGGTLNLTIQGEQFGREQVRALAEQLIEFQRDGGRVVLA